MPRAGAGGGRRGVLFRAGFVGVAGDARQERGRASRRCGADRAGSFLRLYEMPMPTIAAVHGAAIAGGAGLATICDFTLATPAAKFGFTEVRIGFVPALVSAFLALQIGDKRSRDLLLTGRIVDAAEAHRMGLVNEVVAAEKLARASAGAGRNADRQQSRIAEGDQAADGGAK